MLEDTWQTNDGVSGNGGLGAWDNYQMLPTRLKKFDNIGLVEAIVSSILSTGSVYLSILLTQEGFFLTTSCHRTC
jgi:actin-related protein 8